MPGPKSLGYIKEPNSQSELEVIQCLMNFGCGD